MKKSNNSKRIIEIKELSDIIISSLPNQIFKVIGEVSNPKKSNGNLYLSLKDNFTNINCIIWKSVLSNFDSEIQDGDKITVSGTIDYYKKAGKMTFMIKKIHKKEGLGELYKKYEKIKLEFKKKGYFLDVNKRKVPNNIKKILLITSETGAAIQDFFFTIKNNNSKVECDILNVKVQGINCPKNICNNLIHKDNKKKLEKYNLIVITRGGGSFEDLFGFSQPELIEVVFSLKTCVLSAIGHQVDTSLLDLVADYTAPTPSLAAQFIIDHNTNFINNIKKRKEKYKKLLLDHQLNKLTIISNLKENLIKSRNRLNKDLNLIKERNWNIINTIIQDKNNILKKININFYNSSIFLERYILHYKEKLKLLLNTQFLMLNNKLKLLDKKEPITFYNNQVKIKTPEELIKYKTVNILWNNYKFKINIVSREVLIQG